ncbi:MAG TPA: glucoamylase family protein [Candidatus Tectomicrobia bacterium]|nr:glucoamylase family protein [Candidatus Tectomicrobia bacterium]
MSSVLYAFAVAAAWGQDVPGVNSKAEATAMAAPMGLVQRVGDRSVILHWDPVAASGVAGYHVYRAPSATAPFELRSVTLPTSHFVDFAVENDSTYHYRVRAVDTAGRESLDSATINATPQVLDDEAFLDLVQRTAFDYFWYEANPENGLIKDRSSDASLSSIAAVGFGLSALTVGIDRGWIEREAGRARVLATLQFLWNSPHGPEADATGYKGFYYHFLGMQSGRRALDSELSTIDTALLLAGVLHVEQYFDQVDRTETEIRALADAIYRRVDWPWMQVRSAKICHGWEPETGFLPYDWGGYNEAMILYLLALGSPTFPVAAEAWTAWTSSYTWQTHYDLAFVVFPPLFGHQYSHVWVDFRGIQDAYMRAKGLDYFENSRRATLANRAYAIANPLGWVDYGENVWGLTASDIPASYGARGAPPPESDDGTITPTAAGGSFAFTPRESLASLRHMYASYRTKIWGPYGFRDAFNPSKQWFATDYLGIDQGPIVLMIENYRTDGIWDVFMQHPAIQHGLERAGFVPMIEAQKVPSIHDMASQTPPPEELPTHPNMPPQTPQSGTQPAHPDVAPQTPPTEAQPTQQRS